jgi:UDP-glucose 4-epimerase
MAILITGGAGFIGSHTCVELLSAGYDVIVVDNFCNSKPEVIRQIERVSQKSCKLYKVDLLDRVRLNEIFQENTVDAVIHFAGLKAVGESVSVPLKYYHNNITGTLELCEVMQAHGVKRIVFSSSATVYGMNNQSPLTEDMPLGATNPYGSTKLMIEQILRDLYSSDPTWSISLLRYFNPIGAHESGLIGEDPNGIPNNLMPYITKVATGKLKVLRVFGNDYETHDGTGVRDYIHVVDLAKGHIKALESIMCKNCLEIYNLGTGKGHSVLDVIHAFSEATGVAVPYVISDRRPGDIDVCFADTGKAYRELGWKAEKTILEMCRDAWNYQTRHSEIYVHAVKKKKTDPEKTEVSSESEDDSITATA